MIPYRLTVVFSLLALVLGLSGCATTSRTQSRVIDLTNAPRVQAAPAQAAPSTEGTTALQAPERTHDFTTPQN